eukprot:CAMPEP_0173418290 /NCGR_PEP_ID=MMETSP1357-20121228/490_1 /TAXON_ID=77926 /ORGANISM="Hemiselmis rufescens, Strain PCC563" /LENGTH=171 /DNA_ID=CAMNT_0014380761 /DNA_START=334 /DNA_END=845 /DNA_ORIENTATION=+
MSPSSVVSGSRIPLLLVMLLSVVCQGISLGGQGFVFTKTAEMQTVPFKAKGKSLRPRPALRSAPWMPGRSRASLPLAPGGMPLLLDKGWCRASAVVGAVSREGEPYSRRLQRAMKRLEKLEDELEAAEDADPVDEQLVAKLKLRVAEAELKAAAEGEKAGLQVSVAEAKVG